VFSGPVMDFALIFLVFAAGVWFACRSQAARATLAYWIGVVLTVAVFLHHATDKLPLSF
jgi:hypothetical protein